MTDRRGYLNMSEKEREQHKDSLLEWDKVNTKIALEVIKGLWGDGNERIDRIQRAGFDYYAIQSKINMISGVTKDTYGIIQPSIRVRAAKYERQARDARFGKVDRRHGSII